MTEDLSQERRDILAALRLQRALLIGTLDGVAEADANRRTTVSELTLGGLIKHVALIESDWARFVVEGPAGMEWAEGEGDTAWSEAGESDWGQTVGSTAGTEGGSAQDWTDPALAAAWADQFRLGPGETLDGALAQYARVAAITDELVRTVDLDLAHPLPDAPWFTPGEVRTARRTFAHVLAETAQHSGHADIIREALDGRKSMG